MKKHILSSILFGLILAVATPAQAAWYDWMPGISLFKSNQAQNQPAHAIGPNIEAQQPQPHINIPAAAAQGNWFSRIFRNPLAGFYARVSTWWNSSKIAAQNNTEICQTIDRLQHMAQERAQSLLESKQIIADRTAYIESLTKELADVRSQPISDNSAARIAQLQEQIENLRKQNTEIQGKATAELDQQREILAKIAAQKILEEKAKQEEEKAKQETEKKQQDEATIQSLKNFAQRFTTQVEGFQQKATHKLNHLDERVNGIASAIKTKKLLETPHSLSNSITGDFIRLQETSGPSDTAKTDSERGFDKITEHIQMDKAFAQEQIARGKRYAHKLLTGHGAEIPTATQEDYLQSIVALNWFFYDHALQNQQGFDEGTFVIEDKGFKFYNFFMNYIKQMNPAIKGNETDPLSHYSTNPYGYSRDASHFVHMKKKFRPYGIDIRLGKSGELPLLPALKKHMLFGIVNPEKQHIYVKPENHGIYYYDGLIGHIGEFTTAQARKNTIARQILSYFGYELGTDDAENNRKERVPEKFLKQFVQAIREIDSLKEHEKELLKKAKQDGIQTLASPEIAQKTDAAKIQELLQEIHKEYGNVQHRFGREIFIPNDRLLAQLPSSSGALISK